MNFYDIYVTLARNPEAETHLKNICKYCQCKNTLEELKSALHKKPNRSQHRGAFPFDEETGKIYDTLWKAADAENYTTAGKIGRWLMKMVVPPSDDEGMNAFHRRFHENSYSQQVSIDKNISEASGSVNNTGITSNASNVSNIGGEIRSNTISQPSANKWVVEDNSKGKDT